MSLKFWPRFKKVYIQGKIALKSDKKFFLLFGWSFFCQKCNLKALLGKILALVFNLGPLKCSKKNVILLFQFIYWGSPSTAVAYLSFIYISIFPLILSFYVFFWVAMLLGHVNCLQNILKVNFFYEFQLWVNTSSKVGGKVLYS